MTPEDRKQLRIRVLFAYRDYLVSLNEPPSVDAPGPARLQTPPETPGHYQGSAGPPLAVEAGPRLDAYIAQAIDFDPRSVLGALGRAWWLSYEHFADRWVATGNVDAMIAAALTLLRIMSLMQGPPKTGGGRFETVRLFTEPQHFKPPLGPWIYGDAPYLRERGELAAQGAEHPAPPALPWLTMEEVAEVWGIAL
jgi:hypothetical protein